MRQGKSALRRREVEFQPVPKATPRQLVKLREEASLSRALLAVYLRTSVRTLENREQGRARPNVAAALAR